MFRVTEQSTIASVTDLRRRTSDIMERADDGDVVVVQRDNEPHGVYLSYRHYESMMEKLNRLESLELALVALPRKAAIEQGEMGTTTLADMIAEFAPELAEEPTGA